MKARAAAALAASAILGTVAMAACAAPTDSDGELVTVALAGRLGLAPERTPGATAVPLVVDTDLGADDLLALAFLLRHPDVEVKAVTIAATGLVACDPGVSVVTGLFSALQVDPVPVACGRTERGPGGRAFPAEWRAGAARGSGIAPAPGQVDVETAAGLIARSAREVPDLVLVAIGPMTNAADVASQYPDDYAKLAGIHAMAGSVSGPALDGVAEWNAAADPESLQTVLASAVPVTVVPEDAAPTGTPAVLATSPVVGRVVATANVPAWWDLAAAAALVTDGAGRLQAASWRLDPSTPGRLVPTGTGVTRVYRTLDEKSLTSEYVRVFGTT